MTLTCVKGVMTGLDYLHQYGVCYLDDILVTSKLKAVIKLTVIKSSSGIAEANQLVNR